MCILSYLCVLSGEVLDRAKSTGAHPGHGQGASHHGEKEEQDDCMHL